MDAVPSPPTATDVRTELERIRALVRLWDEAVRIPGLGWRVGLDALVGLVPGAGDLVGMVVSLGPVVTAARLGAGSSVVGRMLLNVAIDAAVGAVPLVGDVFDAAWKANRRNLDLLERWLARPDRVGRSSRALLVALGLAGVGVGAGLLWLVWRLVEALAAGLN